MIDRLRQLLGAPSDRETSARLRLLAELLTATSQDHNRTSELLDNNAQRITPELAADAQQLYLAAINAGQYGTAQIAGLTAATLYLRLGNRYQAIRCYLDVEQLQYIEANTLEEYASVEQGADNITRWATEIGASDLIFRGHVLSANCSFFSVPLTQEHRMKTGFLLSALQQLLDGSASLSQPSDDQWFDQFVSLLSALVTDIMNDEAMILFDIADSLKKIETDGSNTALTGAEEENGKASEDHQGGMPPEQRDVEGGGDIESSQAQSADSEADAVYRTLVQEAARVAEQLIPVDFVAREGAEKTISEAQSLARLSYRVGNVQNAHARLDIATDRAEELIARSANYDPWINVVFQRYAGGRDAGASVSELAAMRSLLRARVDQYRRLFHSRGGRLWAVQRLDEIHGVLLQDEVKESIESIIPVVQTFNSIEVAKARVLLDQMCVEFKDLPTDELKQLATQLERQLLRFAPEPEEAEETPEEELLDQEMRIVTRLSIGDTVDRMFGGEDYANRLGLIAQIENLYRTHQAGFAGIQATAQAKEIAQALEPDEVLIEYGIPYAMMYLPGLIVLVITRDQVRGIQLSFDQIPGLNDLTTIFVDGRQPVSDNKLANTVISARIAIQQQEESKAQRELSALYQLLIQTLLDNNIQLQGRKCIIVPHGVLHHVPFAALLSDAGHYLVEDTTITIAPSASTWLEQRKQSRPEVNSFLGFANPDLPYVKLPALPKAKQELDRICKSLAPLPCTPYLNAAATEEKFKAQAEGKSILHLATHGEFPEQDAIDLHHVLLAPSLHEDGRLYAEEIRSMRLKAARLVVLSICDGGLYRVGPGDEPYGLIAALLIAGAENVIATQWPLKDDMGRLFMIEFYKHLLKAGPAEALQQTYKTFIHDQASIRDWAGIIMIGSGKSWAATRD